VSQDDEAISFSSCPGLQPAYPTTTFVRVDGGSCSNWSVSERETDSKENWWWGSQLHDMYWYKEDFSTTTDLDATLKRVTSENVRAAAKHFLDEKNLVEGVLRPSR